LASLCFGLLGIPRRGAIGLRQVDGMAGSAGGLGSRPLAFGPSLR
jgi:hypothetical protein